MNNTLSLDFMKNQNSQTDLDLYWMKRALFLAKKAQVAGEVPVAAIIVHTKTNKLVSKAYNLREKISSPIGHAEILAIHRASIKLKSWRLVGHTLYVTLEPCVMCAGAIIQGRLDRVVFGALDPKGGGVESLYQILSDQRLNHHMPYLGQILELESRQLLQTFFKNLRSTQKNKTPNMNLKK